MFTIRNKNTKEIIDVYGVKDADSWSDISFLVYEDNQWRWVSSLNYEPYHSYMMRSRIEIGVKDNARDIQPFIRESGQEFIASKCDGRSIIPCNKGIDIDGEVSVQELT